MRVASAHMRLPGRRPITPDRSYRLPESILSADQIRSWLKVLHEQFGWPWETLARTLGIGEGKHAASKVRGNSWIYRGEQVRMSRQLAKIIGGQLVLGPPNSRGRRDAVIADHPRPIRGARPMAYDMKTRHLVWPTPLLPGPTLPSFRGVLLEKLLGSKG